MTATPDDGGDPSLARQMAALYRSTGVGLARGEDDLVLEANDEMLRMVGQSRDALAQGLPWRELIAAERRERAALVMERVRLGEDVVALRELVHTSGRRVPVLFALAALESGAGAWVAVVVDLSDDRRMDYLALSEAAIVSTLLDDAPIGFAFIGPDMRYILVNREMAAMNGVSPEDHVGRPVFDVVPGIRETAEAQLREVLATGEPLRDVEVVGETVADPGVTHTWLESFFPVRAPHGTVLGVAAIAREQTEFRRLQAELTRVSERQHSALQQLQHSLLPMELPCPDGYSLTARYLAAEHEVSLGGDWYDAMQTPDGRLVVSVGDIVGHGLEAVGRMASTSAAIEAYIFEGYGPASTLGHVNSLLRSNGPTGLATAVIVSIDPMTGAVEYARAGHPYPLLRGAEGAVRPLHDATGPMLGVLENATYTSGKALLEPGSTLLLYTDGLVERRTESIDSGTERLARVFAGGGHNRGRGLNRSQEELVNDIVVACLGERERRDDTCLVAIHRFPSDPTGPAGTG